MKSFAVLALFSALAAQVYAVTVNTPSNLVQCEPALISWSSGQSPYFLTVYPGGQTTGALKTFSSTTSTSITWTVDIAANTRVTLGVRDGTGQEVYSDAVSIASSSDSSCVNSSASESVSSTQSGGASSSGSPSGTTTSSSGSSTSRSSSSSGSGTATSSSSSSSSSTSSGAERMNTIGAAGLVGLLGAVGAALF